MIYSDKVKQYRRGKVKQKRAIDLEDTIRSNRWWSSRWLEGGWRNTYGANHLVQEVMIGGHIWGKLFRSER